MLDSLITFIAIGAALMMMSGVIIEFVRFAAKAAGLGIVGMLVYGIFSGDTGVLGEVHLFVRGIIEAVMNLNLF